MVGLGSTRSISIMSMNMTSVRGFVAGTISTILLAFFLSYSWNSHKTVEGLEPHAVDEARKSLRDMILKYGAPDRGHDEVFRINFVLSYDQAKRIPLWVAEHLTEENLKGDADRHKARFRADPNVPTIFTATNGDYHDSGWSHGHMAPAEDNRQSQEAMNETFYLSNILPQDIANNGGIWNRLETYCRDLTTRFADVYVTSGPIFLPVEKDGRKFIMYELIGNHEVAVPTHLYKLIVAEKTDVTALGAFIIPNQPVLLNATLKTFQVQLEELESTSGLHFLKTLNRSEVEDLCEVDGCVLPDHPYVPLRFNSEHDEGATDTAEQL